MATTLSNGNGAGASAGPICFRNATIIDGTGREPRTGDVLVQGERIVQVGEIDSAEWQGRLAGGGANFDSNGGGNGNGVRTIDCTGKTVMPGLVMCHVHLSYNHVHDLPDLDLKQPPEVSTIAAVTNARTMLDCGWTAGLSAGALHRVDIFIKQAINKGQIPGPRLLASGRDICQTGGMLDWNPSYWKLGMEGLGIFVDGEWEVRKAVRQIIKEGADMVKMYITGEGLLMECQQTELTCTQVELDAFVEEAKRRNRLTSVHARSAESCKMAVKAGVWLIDHATFLDDEAIDLLAEKRPFVCPGMDYLVSTLEFAERDGFPWLGDYGNFMDKTHYKEELDAAIASMQALHERGVKIVMGSDFGFSWCPHGTYARELSHFVNLIGFTPMEAIVAATRLGAEAMRMQDEIGTLEPGKYADLLVIDGNPLEDISLLEDRRRIAHVMKGGELFRAPLGELVPA